MLELNHTVAVVTGGGSGIGQAIAELFAQRGAHVHVVDLNLSQAAAVAEALVKDGYRASAHGCDVSRGMDVRTVMDGIAAREGSLDILVNCAGIAHIGRLDTTSEEDFDRVYQVNVKGIFHCMQAALPYMLKKQKGVILNMASVASHVGIPDRFAYSMSKGAVLTMTLSVAKDYINRGIRCNSISPARVHTPFVDGFLAKNYPGQEQEMFEKLSHTQPIGRMASPQEVASLALFLCSEEAAFITGCDYALDGGFIRLNN